MKRLLRNLRHGLRLAIGPSCFRMVAVLTLGLGIGAISSTEFFPAIVAASPQDKSDTTQQKLPPWERRPRDLRAAAEQNKLALQLINAVFEARLRRGEAESKFQPTIAPADKSDPLSGPNDLAVSPLLEDFGQGAIWLSIILTAKESELSPRLQQVQRELLEGLPQKQVGDPKAVKKEIKKPLLSKEVEDSDSTQDIQRVLRTERNYQEVVAQLRSAFPQYAELDLHQSPRVLNRPGEPTVFELCDPSINADPLVKDERMQASIIVKVYRYDEHSYKIVAFWLYRNIEDPEIFVPRQLYSAKGREMTRNSEGKWDGTHMPPRAFSAVGYVSQPVTVLTLRFINGEPVIAGRSTPAGRRHVQHVDLTEVELSQLEPSSEGVLDASAPSFPVSVPDIPTLPPPLMGTPRAGRDYMPRIREPYEFASHAEYEAYLAGMREALDAMQVQPEETATAQPEARTQSSTVAAVPAGEEQPVARPATPANIAVPAANLERLNPIFLEPKRSDGLRELSALARESLSQYSDLQSVSTHNLVNLLFEKSNAGLRTHEQAVAPLQQRLPKVQQVNVYFLASENTNASWRGPDDSSGKGGIVVILPTRYYYDPEQFYKYVTSALINQSATSTEVASLASYLGGAAAQPAASVKQFAIETDYLDHGWDEDGDMRKWPDEAVDFFKHLPEAIHYLKPRLETMAPEKSALLSQEVAGVEGWLTSLGEASVTVNFGLYKGKNDAPAPKTDIATRTIWISCKAEEYLQSEQRDGRWPLFAKLMEGFNGLRGGSFDRGMTGAVYDILENFARDKDNKLMIGFRLKTDLPDKPADAARLASVAYGSGTISASAIPTHRESQAAPAISEASVPTGGDTRPKEPAPVAVAEQGKAIEVAQAQVVAAPAASPTPQLTGRPAKASQPTKPPEKNWADPEFGKKITELITTHMKGVDDSSVKGIVLQTMVDRLIVVRDPNPNFHTKVSGINLREPSPDQFDFTANKTAYFDALFALGERDKVAYDVIWSTFEENATTVEYAAGNHDFGPFYKALQTNLGAVEKRHTDGVGVSADIYDDPQFKALVPYYTTFWSNWQFAGEMARFQYLHDHVTAKRLRQLADEAGKSPQTKTVQGELLGLANQVDLFYGDIVQAVNPLRAEDSNAPQSPTSLNTARLAQLSSGNFAHVYAPPTQPWDMKDYNMNQVIAIVQKVEEPAGKHSDYRDIYRRAYSIRLLLDAWGRTGPEQQKKLLAGEWSGVDLRFVLAILSEIQANRIGAQVDSDTIVRLSKDMPWIADPKFDVTKGAFGKLPETLKQTP